jgi:hypothetical protein
MAGINALYNSLLAADEAVDASALTVLAWQIYGQLGTTAADLNALRTPGSAYGAASRRSTDSTLCRKALVAYRRADLVHVM